jgi:hypothetical protein
MSGLLDNVIDENINEEVYESTIANDDWLLERNIDVVSVDTYVRNVLIDAGLTDNNTNLFGCNYKVGVNVLV